MAREAISDVHVNILKCWINHGTEETHRVHMMLRQIRYVQFPIIDQWLFLTSQGLVALHRITQVNVLMNYHSKS
jgi:hypothetical protein